MLVNKNHWNCYLANLKESHFIYLDPRGISDADIEDKFKIWRNFAANKIGLNEIAWTICTIQNQTKQKKTDMSNCGVYVCRYLTCLLNSNFNLNFSNSKEFLKAMRKEMHNTLVASD